MARKQKIEGVENVRRVFRRLPQVSANRITNALNQGLDEIADLAKSIAPEGPTAPHVKDTVRRIPIKASVDGKSVGGAVIAGDTAATANAAFRAEFGRKPSDRHPGHSAQPFMFPAFHARRKKVLGRIARELNKAVKLSLGTGK
jgi:hypothetical protein